MLQRRKLDYENTMKTGEMCTPNQVGHWRLMSISTVDIDESVEAASITGAHAFPQ
jgi:hypothetical protein